MWRVLTASGAIKTGTVPSLDLASATGTLGVAHGGTGDTTITGVVWGTGTAALSVTAIPSDATKFLNGAVTPAYALVKDSDLSTSNITTNDVTIAKHGFAPILPNDATKFLNGTGAYSIPAGSAGWTTTIVKPSDQTVTNSVTLVDDTALTFAVTSGDAWWVEILLLFSGNNASGDYRFALKHPTSTGVGYYMGTTTNPATAAFIGFIANSAIVTQEFQVGTDAASADTIRPMPIYYQFVAEATGTFVFAFANAAAGVGRTSTTRAKSTLRALKISP